MTTRPVEPNDVPARRLKSEDDVYRELGRELRRKPDEAIWRHLEKKRYVADVLNTWEGDSEDAFDVLVEEYRDLEALSSESEPAKGRRAHVPPPQRTFSVPSDPALDALSEILAVEVEASPLVVGFRQRVLGGARVPPEEVNAVLWRLGHGKRPPRLIRMPLGSCPPTRARVNPWDALADAAHYADGDLAVDGHEHDFLACLVDVLMDLYGWPRRDEVMTFVLSGKPPHLQPAYGIYQRRAPFKNTSVHLVVNVQMEPHRLMAMYAEMRRTGMPPGTRIRSPGAAASRLAVFIARHNDGRTWQDALVAWNAEGGRQYTDVRSFSREARKAYQRVTGDELIWGRSQAKEATPRQPSEPLHFGVIDDWSPDDKPTTQRRHVSTTEGDRPHGQD